MAAPLGFKTFTTGEVLTAADTNGYLMQGVLVFADAAARTAAITSPQEGQTSYLKDTDVIQVYSGSAWVTKSGSLPSQTGNAGKYLTTDGTNESWGTVAAGGLTSIASGNLSSTTVTISSIAQTYKNLYLLVTSPQTAGAGEQLVFRFNGNTAGSYSVTGVNSTSVQTDAGETFIDPSCGNTNLSGSANSSSYELEINNYTAAKLKGITANAHSSGTSGLAYYFTNCHYNNTTAISSITITTNTGTATFVAGAYTLYGVN